MITLVILMNCILNDIATCNFLFQWLCLHLTVTNNSCQVWLCFIKSANTFIAVIHLTINFFSNYQHLVVVFTAALSPSIAIHSLLLTHFTNKYLLFVKCVSSSEWMAMLGDNAAVKTTTKCWYRIYSNKRPTSN